MTVFLDGKWCRAESLRINLILKSYIQCEAPLLSSFFLFYYLYHAKPFLSKTNNTKPPQKSGVGWCWC